MKNYVDHAVARCAIRTHWYFGFDDDQHAADEQRVAGFELGMWAQPPEIAFMDAQRVKLGAAKKPTTKLYGNEADISLAARSFHSIVLTRDQKKGPLRDALSQGGQVVLLNDYPTSGLSLRDYVEARI